MRIIHRDNKMDIAKIPEPNPPITWAELRRLPDYKKAKALEEYYEWLEEERTKDRAAQRQMWNRGYFEKNHDKKLQYHKTYHKKHYVKLKQKKLERKLRENKRCQDCGALIHWTSIWCRNCKKHHWGEKAYRRRETS